MNAASMKFDLSAMSAPKSRRDAAMLAEEIISQLDLIDQCIDAAALRCEVSLLAEA
jgi:hypothetical protein